MEISDIFVLTCGIGLGIAVYKEQYTGLRHTVLAESLSQRQIHAIAAELAEIEK